MIAKKIITLALVAFMAVLVAGSGVGSAQEESCETVVVTGDNVIINPVPAPSTTPTPLPAGTWAMLTLAAGQGSFVVGPETPPEGVGSFRMSTPTDADKVTLFNYDHRGTRLADIDRIAYATYRETGDPTQPAQVPAINIEVDFNGPNVAGGFTTLVFEPVYNLNQGAVVDDEWQEWDAYSGGNAIWWSSRAIPGVCAFDCFVSWDTIVQNNPDAVILGGFGVNQGRGNDQLIGYADALTLGYNDDCVTYDFEPYRVAGTKDACKNGGWQTVKRANGSGFKNQGDCVSYTQNGK